MLFPGRKLLKSFLNKNMKIQLTDGRVLIGIFMCTDKDSNVILGSCAEYLSLEASNKIGSTVGDSGSDGEPRILGLAMVPGRHIVSINVDDATINTTTPAPSSSPVPT